MTVHEDPTGTVSLHTDGTCVEHVSVAASWRSRFDAPGLSAALLALLQEAADAAQRSVAPPAPEYLGMTAFWDALDEFHRLLDSPGLREAPAHDPVEVVHDPRQHFGVRYVAGRAQSLGFDDEWVASASTQAISDVITGVLRGRPLCTAPDPLLGRIEHLRLSLAAHGQEDRHDA